MQNRLIFSSLGFMRTGTSHYGSVLLGLLLFLSRGNYEPSPPPVTNCICAGNAIINGSFEEGVNEWTIAEGSKFIATAGFEECGQAYGLLDAVEGEASFWQEVDNVAAGTTFRLKFWAGTHDPSFDHYMEVSFFDEEGNYLDGQKIEVEHDVDEDGKLLNYEETFSSPGGTASLRIVGFANGDFLKVDQVCLQATEYTCTATIEQLILYDVDGDQVITELEDGGVYYLDMLPDWFKIQAIINGNGESVVFDVNGEILLENSEPFNFPATEAGSWEPKGGESYTIHVKVYPEKDAGGAYCDDETITIHFVEDCEPEVEVKVTSVGCGDENGMIAFTFADTPFREDIEFSLDGGQTYPLNVKDDIGSATFENLGPGTFHLFVRWGNDDCPVDLGAFTIDAGGAAKIQEVLAIDASCSLNDGRLKIFVDQSAGTVLPIDIYYTIADEEVFAGSFDDTAGNVVANLLPGSYTQIRVVDANGCEGIAEGPYLIGMPSAEECGSIGDFVFEDLNGNGIRDQGEPGIGGVKVKLLDAEGNVLAETMTNGKGFYEFTGLGAGEYQVMFVAPEGYTASPKDAGESDAEDSDADPETGMTDVTNLEEGEHDPSIDAGYFLPAKLGDYVWEDSDGDGLQDANEPGIENVLVKLKDHNGAILAEMDTRRDGSYEFTGLTPGTYSVQFMLPEGYIFTGLKEGEDDAIDSDADPAMRGMTDTVEIRSGDRRYTIDAGLRLDCEVGTGVISGSEVQCGPFDPSLIQGNDLQIPGSPEVAYQWQFQTEQGDWADIVGATERDYDPVAITVTTTYRRLANAGEFCDAVPSNAITKVVNALPLLNFEVKDATCGEANGTASVVVSGDGEPYTYLWNNGARSATITDLTTGNYAVTVTGQDGCTSTASVAVEESEAIMVDVSIVNPGCDKANGSASTEVTGGTLPYSYIWNTGATTPAISELTPGTYEVTVTDAIGCSAKASVTIADSPGLTLAISSSDATCGDSNGSASVIVEGGTGAFSYQWSNGMQTPDILEIPAGVYEVTVVDAKGCSATEFAVISESNAPTVSIEKQDPTCEENSGRIAVTASGTGLFFTFAWSTGASTAIVEDLPPGTYFVTVSDEGTCRNIQRIDLEDANLLNASVEIVAPSCGGTDGAASIIVAAGIPPYVYDWSTGDTSETVSGLSPGPYSVIVSDSIGCRDTLSFSIQEMGGEINVGLSSEPTQCGSANGVAIVTASGGTAPYTYEWSNGLTTDTIIDLPAGIYTVRVTDAGGCTAEGSIEVGSSTGVVIDLGEDQSFCPEEGITLTASFDGAEGITRIMWSTGEATPSIFVNPEVETAYSVSIEDGRGCTANDEIVVTPSDSLCNGASCVITAEIVETLCDDNGTAEDAGDDLYSIVVNVDAENGGSGWKLGNGTTGVYGEPATFGPFFIAGGTIKLTFIDIDDPDCMVSLQIEPPASCSGASNPPEVACPLSNHFCPIIEQDIMLYPTTDPLNCTASIRIPEPEVTLTSEACDNFEVTTMVRDTNGGIIAVIEAGESRLVADLEIGDYVITYTVLDNCGNVVSQDCIFRIADLEEPNVICRAGLNVSIGGAGLVVLPATVFDVGSYDNCGIERMEVRRVLKRDPLFCSELPTPLYSDWASTVEFTCCDVNDTVSVELRIIDVSGNTNVCWVDVLVEDKTAPLCFGLEDVVVPCDSLPSGFDPADIAQLQEFFGQVSVFDNCSAEGIELEPIVELADPCNGTITRRFVGRDVFGNESAVFEQVITIQGNTANLIGMIKGTVSTVNMKAIEGVEIELKGGFYTSTESAANGRFQFEQLKLESNYRVRPSLNKDPMNGVSTLDLAILNQYLLGRYEFATPYQYIAADINNSKQVTVLDLLELRSLILGNRNHFSNNQSWRFVDYNYDFLEPKNPWFETFKEEERIELEKKPVIKSEFIGVKIGDLDESVIANSIDAYVLRSPKGIFNLNVLNRTLEAGKTYRITFTAQDMAEILGYQGTLLLDPHVLQFVDLEEGLVKKEHFGFNYVEHGFLTTSWHEVENRDGLKGEGFESELFTLVVVALEDGELSNAMGLSSRITTSEAYNQHGEHYDLEIQFEEPVAEVVRPDFKLQQNIPNPFKLSTSIGFVLPEATNGRIIVTDAAGKVVKLITGAYVKGYNQVNLDRRDLPSGIFFYTLEAGAYKATRKLIVNN